MIEYAKAVAGKLALQEKNVAAVLNLLSEGATIPFIARYRKDQTGALDEIAVQKIQEEAQFQKAFSERKAFIEKTIKEQEKMTEAIQKKLDNAKSLNELEDIYLPFKPKRKTKAQKAKEKGLEPLADWLFKQEEGLPEEKAKAYLSKEVEDTKDALKGARDIIAEKVAEDTELRAQLRMLFEKEGKVITKVVTDKEEEGKKYKDYFDFSEAISKIPSHRMLAVLRGFMNGILRLSIAPEENSAFALIQKKYPLVNNAAGEQVEKAFKDAYKRLLQPSLESEFRMALKKQSDEEAIDVFAENLRQLLLSSPLGGKRIIAIDPGYRTGCKVVVLDANGGLKENTLIYVHEKNHKLQEAEQIVRKLIEKYKTECFAIGDGTAGRETEQFIKSLKTKLPVFLVNEDGASVYSASEIAREEFPDYDITVRGAVSIGRRLMDPLAELVKIDPKSIGVGQYQHDVNQVRLKSKLDHTVESCVNAVGVNLNTSGKYLLQYVSGVGSSLADNIVKYREENGDFKSRKDLLNVKRLGASAYEQCAGFLRISQSENPLDNSSVHPEAYLLVEKMAKDLDVKIEDLVGKEKLVNEIKSTAYIDETFGQHTVEDILKELKKPGLDPREEAELFEFAPIYKMEDVQIGMDVPGVVTNLTRFGAFVDIGVKQDGLVHVSEIAHRYISDPAEALKLNQKVKVRVLEVDVARKRISLSIKQTEEPPKRKNKNKGKQKRHKKEKDFNGALAALKKKFG
ncbi:MAG TPA: Tex family protein [Chitinophagaceae bacterium]|nr:Tex family protein [Chitinophagaceae bacterium]